MDDAEAERPPKRRKIRIACQECRDKKTRCDGGRPMCNACLRKRLGPEQCIYLDGTTDVPSRYVQDLEDRIRELEQRAGGGARATDHEVTLSPAGRSEPATHSDSHVAAASLLGLHTHHNTRQNTHQNTHPSTHPNTHSNTHLSTQSNTQSNTKSDTHTNAYSNTRSGHFLDPPAPEAHFATIDVAPMGGEPSHSIRTTHRVVDHQVEDCEDEQPGDAMGASETPNRPGSSLFLGPSSAAAFMRSVRESLGGGEGSRSAEDDVTTSPASVMRRSRLKKEVTNLLDNLILPPRRLADAHLEEYWKHTHPFYPILVKPSFMRRYEQMWTGADGDHDELHHFGGSVQNLRAFHATLNIALALGCINPRSESPSSKSARTYYERSRSLLQDADMDQGSVHLVQALVLTAQYLQSTDMTNRCWVTIGNAIRVAQGIGVHLDRPSESQAEREERRRTWWCCILMDRVLSMTFGRPVMVVWQTTVPKPEPVDDECLSEEPRSSCRPIEKQEISTNAFFTQTLRLTDILMMVLTHLYRPIEERRLSTLTKGPVSDLTLVVEIDHELAAWRRQLPDHLIYQPSERSEDALTLHTRQALLLHCRYLHLRILLFRPNTMDSSNGSHFAAQESHRSTDFQDMMLSGCIRSCTRAAQELVDVLHSGPQPGPTPPRWYTVFYLFTAGTVLLSVLLSPNLQRAYSENLDELASTWSRCMETLALFAEQGDTFSKKCHRILQAALVPLPRPHIDAAVQADDQRLQQVGRPQEPQANQASYSLIEEFQGLFEDTDLGDMIWPAGSQDWLNSLPEDRSGELLLHEFSAHGQVYNVP